MEKTKEEMLKMIEESNNKPGRFKGTKREQKLLKKLEKVEELMKKKNLKFSHEAKRLRITKPNGEISNISTTIQKEVFNQILNCQDIFYYQQVVNGTDILLTSGCQPTSSEPKWLKEIQKRFNLKN